MAKEKKVAIDVGDKVCVEFDSGPCTGVVGSVGAKKCEIGFDDGSTEDCLLEDVKLIAKAGGQEASDDVTQPTKSGAQAVSPNAQQLEQKANANRKGRVDSANKAAAAKEKATDAANAGKQLTAEEEDFVTKVQARLNGKTHQADGMTVRSARITALPSSADMTRYARLVRQRDT